MSLRGSVALAAGIVLVAGNVAASAAMRVNEGATRLALGEDHFDLRLVVHNACGVTVQARTEVELLDPSDTARARFADRLMIGPGTQALHLTLRPGVAGLDPRERTQVLHYRLRYRLEIDPAAPGAPRELGGVLAVSRLMPGVFELRMMASDAAPAGRPLHVAVQAVHPITSRPVRGVSVNASLVLDRHGRAVSATQVTNTRGLAVFELAVPEDIESGGSHELKAVGRQAGLSAEVAGEVQFARFADVLVSTDKPLYQPGQALHVRALVRRWRGGPVVADLPVKVRIRDEENDVAFEESMRTSRFGVVSTDWPIPEHARLGRYQVMVEADEDASGVQAAGASFATVSRYEMPQFAVRATPDRTYFLAGEKASVEIRADYLFGKPVARGRVRVALESRHEWDYRRQRYDVSERSSQQGPLSAEGRFTAAFELDAAEDFPGADDEWRSYRDIEGTAYVTDATTGRTEEGRFTLRTTRAPIHIYVIDRYAEPCKTDERVCRASFYVSTSYADGTPASCEVAISRRVGERPGVEDERPPRLEPLTRVRTNRFGLAKVSDLAIDSDVRTEPNDDSATRLVLTVRDAMGRSGRLESRLGSWWTSTLLVDAGRAVHAPGQALDISLRSQSVRGPVLVDVVSPHEVLASRLVLLNGPSARVVFPYLPTFSGALSVVATPMAGDSESWRWREAGSFGVVYPTAPELRVEVKSDRQEYQPGEEAELRVSLKDGDGRPARGLLGLVVLDKALEERAAADRGLWHPAGFLDPLRDSERGDSVAGVSLPELLAIDVRHPVAADLDLVAELLLSPRPEIVRNRQASKAFDRDTAAAFRPRFERQLRPMAEALRTVFDVQGEGPRDQQAVERALARQAVIFEALRDPWGRPFRVTTAPDDRMTVVQVRSDGPDRAPATADDLVALSLAWAYFAPRGRLMDRAAQSHYERTGAPIRDLDTLRGELRALGEDADAWRDPWGRSPRFEFAIEGSHAVVTARSAGPDGAFDTDARRSTDDVTLSTVRTEYFARERQKLQEALDSRFAAAGHFPQNAQEWEDIVSGALGSNGLVDPWGHPLDFRFHSESAFANRLTIRSYVDIQRDRARRTEVSPVTRAVEVVSAWSAGPDGVLGGRDDFELASFRRTVVEMRSAVQPPSAGHAVVLARGEGAIVGTVVDQTGAVIPGAGLDARRDGTGPNWKAVTDANGRYALKGLAPGLYTVTAALPGFKDAVVTRVPVEAGGSTELDVTLAVADVTEAVMVAAESPRLSTSTASMAMVIDRGVPAAMPRLRAATPRVRRDFPETLFWQPALETDELGRALVRVKLADTVTTWKLALVGSTTAGQIVTAERELLAFQPFFVENDPPPILTTGDAIGLPALVRNYTERALRVSVSADADHGLRVAGLPRQQMRVPAGDSARTTFDLRAEGTASGATVKLTATGDGPGDAVEKRVNVHPDGAETETSNGLLVDGEAVLELSVPDHAIAASLRVELRVAPNLEAHVLESVEAVMQRPYGCAEQTISSTYPSLMALRLIAESGSNPAVESRARRYLTLGYQRLLGYQLADGGFTYFHGNDADLAVTAYAVRFLLDARSFVDVDENVLDHAREYLLSKQEADGHWWARHWWQTTEDDQPSLSLTAVVARALAALPEGKAQAAAAGTERRPRREALERALAWLVARSEERDDPYALASLALAAQAAGVSASKRAALTRLRALARSESGGSYWSDEVNTPFFGWGRAGRIESTALAVKALAGSAETADRPLVDRGLLFLLRNRDHYGIWWSGQATVNVLDALTTLIGGAPEPVESDALDVVVDGRKVTTLALKAGSGQLTVDLTPHVGPGAHRIGLRGTHGGRRASAQAVASFYVPWPQATIRTTDSLRFAVRFDRNEARRGEPISVHVEAERVGFEGYGMLLAEIGLPPGVEVDRESLERAVSSSGWRFCRYDVQPDRVVAYLWPRAGGMAFDFVVRPRLSMRAQSAAAKLYDYYNPEAAVTLPPQTFVVRDEAVDVAAPKLE